MSCTRCGRAAAFGICLIFITTFPALAQDISLPTREEEDEQFSFHFGYFRQTDGLDNLGGNPFIDEEETVYEALIVLDQKMSERDMLQVRLLGDLVSSASITRETNSQFQALQAHPSGNKRGELGFGWTRDYEDYKLGGQMSIGGEYSDFRSVSWGIGLSAPLANENTQLRLKYQGYRDSFAIKLFDGTEPGRDQRSTHTLEGGVTQVLTPTTVVDLTLNHTRQSGYLATTWHSVFVNGTEVSETMPSLRKRNSVTARVKQSLGETNAMEIGYRFYDDDWGVRSHTFEAKYLQYALNRRLLLEPNVRYTDQRGAYFFAKEFTTQLAFMTSDPDLGYFYGRSAGIKGTALRTDWLPGRKADLSISYDFYQRSDGVDFWWTIFGYTIKF